MPAVQLHTLNAAASDAAGSGDFPAAVALLRQFLESQTSLLGPDHPDLATTLNNLALMLERSGDTAEAGRCYRRALALARLAHGPDAASVMVSQANLAAFYREHGADGNDDPNVSPGGLDDFAPPSAPASTRNTAVPAMAINGKVQVRPLQPLAQDRTAPSVPTAAGPGTTTAANAARPTSPPTAASRLEPPLPAHPAPRPWRNPETIAAIKQTPEVRLPIFAARRAPAPLPAPPMRPLFIPQEAPSFVAPNRWRHADPRPGRRGRRRASLVGATGFDRRAACSNRWRLTRHRDVF